MDFFICIGSQMCLCMYLRLTWVEIQPKYIACFLCPASRYISECISTSSQEDRRQVLLTKVSHCLTMAQEEQTHTEERKSEKEGSVQKSVWIYLVSANGDMYSQEEGQENLISLVAYMCVDQPGVHTPADQTHDRRRRSRQTCIQVYRLLSVSPFYFSYVSPQPAHQITTAPIYLQSTSLPLYLSLICLCLCIFNLSLSIYLSVSNVSFYRCVFDLCIYLSSFYPFIYGSLIHLYLSVCLSVVQLSFVVAHELQRQHLLERQQIVIHTLNYMNKDRLEIERCIDKDRQIVTQTGDRNR